MVYSVALIIVFVIIVLGALLLSLVAFLWFSRRRDFQQHPAGRSGKASLDVKVNESQEVPARPVREKLDSQDELDESQAAEITATWNILNPP